MKLRSPRVVKTGFQRAGLSISAWAVEHGFSPNLVYMVLNGKRKAVRGQSHRIAVALGIKTRIHLDRIFLEKDEPLK